MATTVAATTNPAKTMGTTCRCPRDLSGCRPGSLRSVAAARASRDMACPINTNDSVPSMNPNGLENQNTMACANDSVATKFGLTGGRLRRVSTTAAPNAATAHNAVATSRRVLCITVCPCATSKTQSGALYGLPDH